MTEVTVFAVVREVAGVPSLISSLHTDKSTATGEANVLNENVRRLREDDKPIDRHGSVGYGVWRLAREPDGGEQE